MDIGNIPGCLGIGGGDDLHTARGIGDHDILSQGLEDQPEGQYLSTTLTGAVPGTE
jgi:hypothetical protein